MQRAGWSKAIINSETAVGAWRDPASPYGSLTPTVAGLLGVLVRVSVVEVLTSGGPGLCKSEVSLRGSWKRADFGGLRQRIAVLNLRAAVNWC